MRNFLVFFAIILFINSAKAEMLADCPEEARGTLKEWSCFGQVEYSVESEIQPNFRARFVIYNNEERLFERDDTGSKKTMLVGKNFTLYKGLNQDDSTTTGASHPFMFFEFALIQPLAIITATNKAPRELPIGKEQISYTRGGEMPALFKEIASVKGIIERTSATDYQFDAISIMGDGDDAPELTVKVKGRWSNALVDHFPDEMLMTDWQYGCKPREGEDARGNHRIVPPGITLGDVRRGWKGSCE
jgi:hypothetical protein